MNKENLLKQLNVYLHELHKHYEKTNNINILNSLIKHYITLIKHVDSENLDNNELLDLFNKVENIVKQKNNELL